MSGCPETETGQWTGWYLWNEKHGKSQTKCQIDHDGWIHELIAEANEPRPDYNHIHIKSKNGTDGYVLCSIKIDEVNVINRGLLLNKINALLGTTFTVQGE